MRGYFYLGAALLLLPFSAKAENVSKDGPEIRERLDSVIVSAGRADRKTPVTFTMIGKKELRATNPINSIPMALSLQPSITSSNEGGTGLGYSKMSVRGSSGTQINITLNGITLNDSESQEVFWVNIPALSNILSSIQIQRGLGTSANGAGAFGASINMSTASVGTSPFANMEYGRGSWNTSTTTVSAGTGLLPSGLYASFAYSYGNTDGYIRNAYGKVQSAFGVIGWMKGSNSLKLTYLMGNQHTGITWMGLPLKKYNTGDLRYNSAGEYYDKMGNALYYNNETDNYTQHHIQLNFTHRIGEHLFWSTTANWTKGNGYYEQFKQNAKMKKYGYSPVEIDGTTYKKSDFIIRKALDNGYYVLNSNLKYIDERLMATAGVYLSSYSGKHFGDVVWASVLGDMHDYSDGRWYDNNAKKYEATAFARAEYDFGAGFSAFADLQYRGIRYAMQGPDDKSIATDYKNSWNFFNPRAGLSWISGDFIKVYGSVALGHREPGRSDLKENIRYVVQEKKAGRDAQVNLKPEKMFDVEFGMDMKIYDKLSYSVNFYMMEYRDMLLETGRLNESGYPIKENVPVSYRRGVELAAFWKVLPELHLDGNLALSMNKIKNYTAQVTQYDNQTDYHYLGVLKTHYDKVSMLNSPSIVGMARLSFMPFRRIGRGSLKSASMTLDGKFVGRQYWDNTENIDRAVPAYFVANMALNHEFSIDRGKLGLGAYINNLFNSRYYAYAWVSRTHFKDSNEMVQYEGLYPQSPINFMFKIYYRF